MVEFLDKYFYSPNGHLSAGTRWPVIFVLALFPNFRVTGEARVAPSMSSHQGHSRKPSAVAAGPLVDHRSIYSAALTKRRENHSHPSFRGVGGAALHWPLPSAPPETRPSGICRESEVFQRRANVPPKLYNRRTWEIVLTLSNSPRTSRNLCCITLAAESLSSLAPPSTSWPQRLRFVRYSVIPSMSSPEAPSLTRGAICLTLTLNGRAFDGFSCSLGLYTLPTRESLSYCCRPFL